ncbi:MAG: hypothetical protein HY767_02700, partial [Candidatus Omnitrophica bacterium]|nr:hypothetical protein [Candidatus Omnitrophota bacterium]
MRIKNFLILLIAIFLSATVTAFAQENTPAVEVQPVTQSAGEVQSVAEAKPGVNAAAEVKPAISPVVEIKMAAQPVAEVKPHSPSKESKVNGTSPGNPSEKENGGQDKPVANLFAEHFFAPAPQKLDHKMSEVRGFPVLKSHSREQDAEFSIVTDFGGGAVKSRHLSGLKDMKAVDEHIKKNLKTANFEGVEIRQLSIPVANRPATELYWVGNRAYPSAEVAMTAIIASKSNVELQGG